jgi:hypothetical protein
MGTLLPTFIQSRCLCELSSSLVGLVVLHCGHRASWIRYKDRRTDILKYKVNGAHAVVAKVRRCRVFGVRSSDVVIKVEKSKIEQLINDLTFKFRKGMIRYKINIKGDGYEAVDFDRVSRVLIDVLDFEAGNSEINLSYYGLVVTVQLASLNVETAVYCKKYHLLTPQKRNILGILSRHFLADDKLCNNDTATVENMALTFGDDGKSKNWINMKYLGKLDKSKKSGDHHLLLTAE